MIYKSFKFFEDAGQQVPDHPVAQGDDEGNHHHPEQVEVAAHRADRAFNGEYRRTGKVGDQYGALDTGASTKTAQGLLRNTASRGGDSGHFAVFSPHIAQYIGFIHGLAGAYRWGWRDRWRGWRAGAAAENRYAQCQRQG